MRGLYHLANRRLFFKLFHDFHCRSLFWIILDSEQLSQIENLEPASPEMIAKVQQLSAQIPGFADELEQKFQEAVTYIKQNSKIPESTII